MSFCDRCYVGDGFCSLHPRPAKQRPGLRILRALEVAINIAADTPRGGDLPEEDDMGPNDPTDEDLDAASEWVADAIAKATKT